MEPDILIELSKILAVTIVITGIVKIARQPVILGYIISGIILANFGIIESDEIIDAFSILGIVLLLFFVGLHLNPRVIKDVGPTALITGVSQVLITTSIGFGVATLLGFTTTEALFIGIGLAFSSTIIIMKLLSDKKDLDALYGRIATGFLIVQDLLVIVALLVLSSVARGDDLISVAIESFIYGIIAILILFVIAIYILPHVTHCVAKSQEYLLLFSLTWCFIVASAFELINFSIEAGALLAGVALSMSPYNLEISSKLKPLRDFFLVLFFIWLGSEMVFNNFLELLPIILLLAGLVSIGNPIIVLTIMGRMGYTKRNSFLAGLTVAQMSEFSLIFISLGMTHNFVDKEILSLMTAVALVTFAASTYMILYADSIYPKISRYLSIFEKGGKKVDEKCEKKCQKYDIIMFGYNRIGFDILESLEKIKKKFLIIDHDPEVINHLQKKGYECIYGDANDFELLNEINFLNAKMVISTIPKARTNLLIIHQIREANKKAIVAVVSHQIDEAISLYNEGATYVLMPHFLGGKKFSTMLERNKLSLNKFLKDKIAHLENLHYRKEAGHEHPRHDDK
ncbi:MAG: cation:proton antiporter [Candidatus Nanoarchaeia archaeon]